MNKFKHLLIFKDRIMSVGKYSAWEAECRGIVPYDAPLDLSLLLGIKGGRGGFNRNVIPHARYFNKISTAIKENSSQSRFMEYAFWVFMCLLVFAVVTAFCEADRFW